MYLDYLRISPTLYPTVQSRIVQVISEIFAVQVSVDDLGAQTSNQAPPGIALIGRIAEALPLIVRAVSLHQPVLLVGPDGCGKSECVTMLAALAGKALERVCITGETEASELVGQLSPATMSWSDGPVTRAIRSGGWCLLDNLDAAEAVVMERLNPLLENQPVWQLSEKDDNEVVPIKSNSEFLMFATMTADGKASGRERELSPALYNRFTIVYLSDVGVPTISESQETAFARAAEEVNGILQVVGGNQIPADLVVKLGRALLQLKLGEAEEAGSRIDLVAQDTANASITVRSIARVADCFVKLQHLGRFLGYFVDSIQWLLSSLQVNVLQPIRDESVKARTRRFLESALGVKWGSQADYVEMVRVLGSRGDHEDASLGTYVLDPVNAPERNVFAQATALGLLCSYPVLLEGPAATGKTALVEYLSLLFTGNQPLRVINTDSTSVQDYVGSYLPQSAGSGGLPSFTICKGPLWRALEQGSIFFADEFNLAEPVRVFLVLTSLGIVVVVPGRIRCIYVHLNGALSVYLN